MTPDKFKELLKVHGVLEATTKGCHCDNAGCDAVPSGTTLMFVLTEDGVISSKPRYLRGHTNGPDDEWFWDAYKGEFIDVDTVFPLEHKWLKEGDKVDISPNLKNHPDFDRWPTERKAFAGERGLEIWETSVGDYKVYNEDKTNWWFIPSIYVKPHIETEEAEEMTLAQVCKELGRNIKIIK